MTPAQSPGPQPMSPSASNMGAPFDSLLSSAATNPCLDRGSINMCDPAQLSAHVKTLRSEVVKLRNRLQIAEQEHIDKMAMLEKEEREQREQNIRLRRKLQMEIERRERLCRHLRSA